MKKRFISTLLCAAMTAALVTGCGSGSAATGSSTGAAADTAGKKEVVIWDYFETDAQKAMMQTLLDGFNRSQEEYVASHVYVPFSDYEKQLTLGIASGELPDLVILDGCSMASFISLGLFGDISGADIKWDEYIAGPMESAMADGKHYGIPFATNCTALFYNKDMFDAAGIAYPDENTTWDDFHEMAKALTKDGVTVLPKKNASSGQATSILGGENMGVVAKDDTAGAVAFLKYYDQTSVMAEAMKQYGSFPPKTEAAKDAYWTEDPVQAEFITQLTQF